MSVGSTVAQGRARAESLRMLDTFDIKAPNGAYVLVNGIETEDYDLLFSTPGRVKSGGLVARESQVGDRTSVTVSRELHIPVDSPAVPDGSVAFVTSVHATSDPTLAGARLRVTGPAPGSQTTARRLQVEEVIS